MNDARPVDLDVLHADFGHIDVHMLQYSGRHLVPDGLRHARAGQGGVRHPETSAADGPLPAVHRAGRRDVGDPVGRPAVLPGSRAARPQRRSRRPGQHLPRPDGLPRPDAHARPRRRAADDPRLDGRFRWLAVGFADATRCPTTRWRRSSPPARPPTSPTTPSGWRRCWPPRRRAGRRPTGEPLLEPLRALFEPIMSPERPDLRRHRLPGGAAARARRRSCWTSRNALCANRFRTRSSATASRSPPSWCAPCCATTSPTGSTRSSCRRGSRRGGSAGTTSSSTRSSSA